MISYLIGFLLFVSLRLFTFYFFKDDVTVDRLLRTVILGLIPCDAAFILIFLAAAIIMDVAMRHTVIVSDKVVFNWSVRK